MLKETKMTGPAVSKLGFEFQITSPIWTSVFVCVLQNQGDGNIYICRSRATERERERERGRERQMDAANKPESQILVQAPEQEKTVSGLTPSQERAHVLLLSRSLRPLIGLDEPHPHCYTGC